MEPENEFIYWVLTEYYNIPIFPEGTDFYNISLCPAEKNYISIALDYIIAFYDDVIYIGHMLPRIQGFVMKLK